MLILHTHIKIRKVKFVGLKTQKSSLEELKDGE